MTDFVLLRPYFLLLLIPFGLLLTALFFKRNEKDAWAAICDPHLYQFLAKEHAHKSFVTPKILFALCGLLTIFSLSGPSWQKKVSHSFIKSDALTIALDLSNAMTAQDIQPSRIERAKYKLQDLLALLEETEIGFVAFSDEAFIVSPLTTDTNTLKLFLPELHPNIMPTQGHNLSNAMVMASDLLKNASKQQGHILIITAEGANNKDMALARKLKNMGYTINILGLGTKYGAPILNEAHQQIISRLDEKSLQQLAAAGGGYYQTLTVNDSDIKQLLNHIRSANAHYKSSEALLTVRKDNGHLLLFLIVPLFLPFFRKQFMRGLLS